MQFRVGATPAIPGSAFNLANLQAALPVAYVASQPPPIVPQSYYPGAYNNPVDQTLAVNATSMTYTPVGGGPQKTVNLEQKAITEVFDPYGRLSARLGYEYFNPTTNPPTSNGVGFAYIDPPAEIFQRGQVQLWKITHNGVDYPSYPHPPEQCADYQPDRLGRDGQKTRALREGLEGNHPDEPVGNHLYRPKGRFASDSFRGPGQRTAS